MQRMGEVAIMETESRGTPDDLIASVTFAKVGSLLNELNIALPALQRVLDQVAPAAGVAKRRKPAGENVGRPLKQRRTESASISSADCSLLERDGAVDTEILAEKVKATAEGGLCLSDIPAEDGEALERGNTPVEEDGTNGESGDGNISGRESVQKEFETSSGSRGRKAEGSDGHIRGPTGDEKTVVQGAGDPDLTAGKVCEDGAGGMDVPVTSAQGVSAIERGIEPLSGPERGSQVRLADDSAKERVTDDSAKERFPGDEEPDAVHSKFATSLDSQWEKDVRGEEALLDRTSVVLLTLSQMAKLRGNRPPTEVENNLMTEAYDNVYQLTSKVAPKDLVSKQAIDRTLCGLGLREREPSVPPELAPETPRAENRIPIKVSPSVAAVTAAAAQELLVKQGRASSQIASGQPASVARASATPGSGPGTLAPPPSQAPERPPPNVRYGPPLAGQVTPAEAAAIALAAGQGKVLTELDRHIRAAGQPPTWQIGIPTGLPDRKATEKKIEAHLREQQQLMTQFRQVEMIEQHVAGRLRAVQQQLDAYLLQERQMEDQSLSLVAEVQLKLSQLRHEAAGLQTHQQQLAKAKKTVLQKHVAIQHEKQILATAPFLGPRASVEFPVTCPVCQKQDSLTPAIIVCDVCNRGYHTRCVLPPQSAPLPNDCEWACPICRSQPPVLPKSLPPPQGGGFAGRASPLGALAASLGASVSATPSGPYYSGGVGTAQVPPPQPKLLNLLGPSGHQLPLRTSGPSNIIRQNNADVSRPIRGDVILGTPVLEGVVLQRPDNKATHLTVENISHSRGVAKAGDVGGGIFFADVRAAASDSGVGTGPLVWVGGGVRHEDGSVHYTECVLNGRTYRLGETVELRSDTSESPPFVGRIQALWEGPPPGQERVRVNWCYAPSDLPSSVQTPEASGVREVYESNHSDDNPVGSILGPCLLLPQQAFEVELEHRRKAGMGPFAPLYLCNWSYDAQSGKFMIKGL